MPDEIEDGDAITYATQFHAAVANRQLIRSAHLSGQAALQLAGPAGHDHIITTIPAHIAQETGEPIEWIPIG